MSLKFPFDISISLNNISNDSLGQYYSTALAIDTREIAGGTTAGAGDATPVQLAQTQLELTRQEDLRCKDSLRVLPEVVQGMSAQCLRISQRGGNT